MYVCGCVCMYGGQQFSARIAIGNIVWPLERLMVSAGV